MKLSKLFRVFVVVVILFSLVGCDDNSEQKTFSSYKDLNGEKIVCWGASVYEDAVHKYLPNSETVYMDVLGDMITSMYEGKVSGVCYTTAFFPNLKSEFPELVCINDFEYEITYSTGFAKNEKGKKLRDEFNEFLNEIKQNGRYYELVDEWIGTPEHGIEGINDWDTSNGTVKALCGFSTPPFVYIYNNELSGFEMALFSEFCKENHYKFVYEVGQFESLFASLETGLCDVGISGFQKSDERGESLNFSDPIYIDNAAIYTIGDLNNIPEYSSLDELNGKRVATVEGTIDSMIVDTTFPDSEQFSYKTYSDAISALQKNKADFVMVDSLKAKQVYSTISDLTYIDEGVYDEDIGYFTSKDSEIGKDLLNQLNEFIENNRVLINDIRNNWMDKLSDAESLEVELDPNNEELKFGITGTTEPYSFIRDGDFVGMDIDIIKCFCKEYNYSLTIEAYDYSGLIPAVQVGKADIGGSGICITEERKQAVNFTIPYATEQMYAVVRKVTNKVSFIDQLKDSFYKNFIKEERWKLILSGILSTLKISFFSVLFGTIVGFIFYVLSRTNSKFINQLLDKFSNLLDGLPMVVILMILYYVIFSSSSFSAELVSIIAFSLTFSLGVYAMLKTAVKSIDIGQNEASFSLGFSDRQTFFMIILPQALTQFMPNYKSAIVNLVKGTAVVGYIAVQDLTKASDMIRSRTYEAFFPIISTAIIYLLLGKLLVYLINRIEFKIDKESRTNEKILRKFKK